MSATNYAMLYQRWEASVADCEALRAEVARLIAAAPDLLAALRSMAAQHRWGAHAGTNEET